MSGPAGPGDNQAQPARFCCTGVIKEAVGCAMRGDDAGLVADPQPFEGARGVLHRIPVGLAPHDDTHRPTGVVHTTPFGSILDSRDYRKGTRLHKRPTATIRCRCRGVNSGDFPPQAMMSGNSSLSILVIWSLSNSFRFFSRCNSSW